MAGETLRIAGLVIAAAVSLAASAPLGATALNDLPGTAQVYTAAETDAAIERLAPRPDYSTNNTELVATIREFASEPGNYPTVSNRAMSAVQTLQAATNYANWVALSATNYANWVAESATNYANFVAESSTNYTDSAISNVMSDVKAGATDWYIPEKYDGLDIILVYTNLPGGTGWAPFPVDMRYNIGIPKGDLSSTNLVWTSSDAAQDIHASRILLRPTPEMEAYWNSKQDSLTFDSRPAPTSINPVTSEGIYQSMISLESMVINSALDSTNYVNASISTNNAAFVAAVLAAPIVGASPSDLADIAEYGSYGTVGAAILALIAGLAALKRDKANKTDLPYPFAEPTLSNGTLTITPRTVATYTADSSAASFTVAVGTGVENAARDCVLVVDCATNTGAVAPTVTWPSSFHPRTDAGTDFACEAGVRNVFYISEYAPGEFVVGGWHEEVA